jgi:hypothetical protein
VGRALEVGLSPGITPWVQWHTLEAGARPVCVPGARGGCEAGWVRGYTCASWHVRVGHGAQPSARSLERARVGARSSTWRWSWGRILHPQCAPGTPWRWHVRRHIPSCMRAGGEVVGRALVVGLRPGATSNTSASACAFAPCMWAMTLVMARFITVTHTCEGGGRIMPEQSVSETCRQPLPAPRTTTSCRRGGSTWTVRRRWAREGGQKVWGSRRWSRRGPGGGVGPGGWRGTYRAEGQAGGIADAGLLSMAQHRLAEHPATTVCWSG